MRNACGERRRRCGRLPGATDSADCGLHRTLLPRSPSPTSRSSRVVPACAPGLQRDHSLRLRRGYARARCAPASSASGGTRSAARRRRGRRCAGRREADVAIVGAGYTGLWTRLLPQARRSRRCGSSCSSASVAGFGASGRNGGWVSGFFSGPRARLRAPRRPAATAALQRAMFDDRRRGRRRRSPSTAIDADFLKGGQLAVALGERAGRAPARRGRATPAGAASARRTCASSSAAELARAGARRGRAAARASHRTSRACTRPSCCAGWPATVEALGRRDPRAHAGAARSPRTRRSRPPARVRARWVRARDRGLHRRRCAGCGGRSCR